MPHKHSPKAKKAAEVRTALLDLLKEKPKLQLKMVDVFIDDAVEGSTFHKKRMAEMEAREDKEKIVETIVRKAQDSSEKKNVMTIFKHYVDADDHLVMNSVYLERMRKTAIDNTVYVPIDMFVLEQVTDWCRFHIKAAPENFLSPEVFEFLPSSRYELIVLQNAAKFLEIESLEMAIDLRLGNEDEEEAEQHRGKIFEQQESDMYKKELEQYYLIFLGSIHFDLKAKLDRKPEDPCPSCAAKDFVGEPELDPTPFGAISYKELSEVSQIVP